MEISIVSDAALIFGAAIGVIYVCHKLKIPALVGFLLTGVLIGPGGFGLIGAAHEVEVMAEIGIILLLFTIGLELSLAELIRLKKQVFLGGGAQVLMTGLFFFLAGLVFGLPAARALFLGFLASLSSTAIVLKLLQERAEIESFHGRLSLSALIFQDLIIVPMMLFVPFLAGQEAFSLAEVAILALKAAGVILAVLILARYVVPAVFTSLVRTRIRELFLLATLGLCLSVAALTAGAGLSLSLGAFLAGLIISESEFSLSALEGMIPFRDVFTSLFFISVGMLLNSGYLLSHLPLVLLVSTGVLAAKAVIAGGAITLLGYSLRPSVLVGLAICQVGEFSFILAKRGMDVGLMTRDGYQLFLSASILTMAATPFIIKASPRLAERIQGAGLFERLTRGKAADFPQAGHGRLEDHLIIVGFGVGGMYLARAAKASNIPYLILEMNPDTVRSASNRGEPISYGDATHRAVLEHAGIDNARVLAVMVPDPASVRRITAAAKALNPALHIIARTRFVSEMEPLKALGAQDVIPEEFETSIEIFSRVLREYMTPKEEIARLTAEVRAEGYGMLRDADYRRGALERLSGGFSDMEVGGIRVLPGSFMDGKSLEESGLRREHGLTIVAVERGNEVTANPGGEFVMRADDTAYVFGPHKIIAEKCRLFSGPGADSACPGDST